MILEEPLAGSPLVQIVWQRLQLGTSVPVIEEKLDATRRAQEGDGEGKNDAALARIFDD